ncbi:MAG: tRNA (adenosine(37)-N6)-dimethylallyltransferase MiaA [Pseudobdellovibrionaceae bacterium]
MALPKVTVIAGPTASGKSALALDIARGENGVIINADSLQIFQGLPLLTACPSAEDRAIVPHRLYEVLAPDVPVTAVSWSGMALDEIRKAHESGQHPILVGGTGFYLKTLIEGLSPIPSLPPTFRLQAEEELETLGVAAFFAMLSHLDPAFAAGVDSYNSRRLVRAYEVYLATGKPMSYWQSLPREPVSNERYDFDVRLVLPARKELYERCNERLLAMIDHGVLDEVRVFDSLIARGEASSSCGLVKALGFKALQAHVHDEIDLGQAITLAQNQTRAYAKRQETWFRYQMQSSI